MLEEPLALGFRGGRARSEGAPEAEPVEAYYRETGLDYAAWSPDFHMHFGYLGRGLDPFRREPMLREMTRQVWRRLALGRDTRARVVDLGCGLAAPARQLAREHPRLDCDALTIVPWQVEQARRLVGRAGLEDRVRVHHRDYRATGFPDDCFDGGFAIESACHDRGLAKERFAREAGRILRDGARLVVADGFFKGSEAPRGALGAVARRIARNWAVETFAALDPFCASLRRRGFDVESVEDVSWRIAPSVLHAPWVTARFLAERLRRGEIAMSRRRWGHLLSCLLAPVLGMARHRFGYYLVVARRRAES